MKMSLEKLPQALDGLYRSFGYVPYTMSKFEEYELYLRNKDFLISDRVLTFTDTDGKLMALKPDVTLSIIKNTRPGKEAIRKVFYQENVYRPGRSMEGFREIMQIGLECMGQVDRYCVLEVLMLAVKSLAAISDRYVLDVSHMGLLSTLLDRSGLKGSARSQVLEAVSGKNPHEIRNICQEQGVACNGLVTLAELYGKPEQVMPSLEAIFPGSPELDQLKSLLDAMETAGCAGSVNIDFSVINDMKYYNGIVFRGFVEGVPEGVLSGGQYDGLMERMHHREKAIGFALYPDLLERLEPAKAVPPMDAVLIYPANADLAAVTAAVANLQAQGLRVSAQPDTGTWPADCAKLYTLEGNEVRSLG